MKRHMDLVSVLVSSAVQFSKSALTHAMFDAVNGCHLIACEHVHPESMW